MHKELLMIVAALAVGFFIARKFPSVLAGVM